MRPNEKLFLLWVDDDKASAMLSALGRGMSIKNTAEDGQSKTILSVISDLASVQAWHDETATTLVMSLESVDPFTSPQAGNA